LSEIVISRAAYSLHGKFKVSIQYLGLGMGYILLRRKYFWTIFGITIVFYNILIPKIGTKVKYHVSAI